MQAQHYHSDLRDVHFNLFEFLDVGRGAMDEDSIRPILSAVEKLARTEIAASFADADRHPPTIGPDGTPILPESLKKSIRAWQDGDWHRLALREDMGGFGAPRPVAWAAFELVVGANASAGFYVFDTFISGVIGDEGTPEQRARFFPRYVDRRWGAAMVLTEPDAGSDVGSARTIARHVEGDVWEIEGTKRFITSGDYDLPENIVHLVLARPVGARPGTKGLSMFIVPKYWVNPDGSMGARNGMRCIGIEKKMGIKASVTCEMAYGGGDTPCLGLLVGNTHDGIRQMFNVIEGARLAIGFKSMSEVSTAYFNALHYAKERVQGPDLAQATAKDSPRVPIIRHPDVRRMLMHLKAHVHGMRALCYYVADLTQQLQDARADKSLEHKVDLLLPLVKGYCSEKGYELLSTALQVFGGSGYVQDHPIEQYIRDQKIDTIYEGTTHIQALDLLFRKIMRDGGATLRHLMGEVQQTIEQKAGGEALEGARSHLARALGDLQGLFMSLLGLVQKSVYHAGMQGNRVLFAVAEVVIGWLLVRQGALAQEKLATAKGDDLAFYTGKVAAAKWFCREVLPGVTLTRKLVEQSSIDVMELPDEAF